LKALKEALKVNSGTTINEIFALNMPVTIVENGSIYMAYRDGRKEFIQTIEKVESKMKIRRKMCIENK
jgi:hypothetical protein